MQPSGKPALNEMQYIIHVAAEAFPFSKKGGLGDFVGSFPYYLEQASGIPNIIISPYYGTMGNTCAVIYQSQIYFNGEWYDYEILEAWSGEIRYLFVRFEEVFTLSEVYPEGNRPYDGEVSLFYFIFAKAINDFLMKEQFPVRTLFTHDWHAAAIYLYLRENRDLRTIHIIHNYHHQGEFYSELLDALDEELPLEYKKGGWARSSLSMNQIALSNTDRVITVSPGYAKELREKVAPHLYLEAIDTCQNNLIGFLNGIDKRVWNPQTDPYLFKKYSVKNLKDKQLNRDFLMNELGFRDSTKPIVLFLGRLTQQKGIDLFINMGTGRYFSPRERMEQILATGINLVVCGNSEGGIKSIVEREFNMIQKHFPSHFRFISTYTEEIAHRLLAGADILIHPSRYEPCGLTPMYAHAYGTVPLVTPVGGLQDIVLNCITDPERGNGFWMKDYSFLALLEILEQSVEWYHNKLEWEGLITRGMNKNHCWSERVKPYLELCCDER